MNCHIKLLALHLNYIRTLNRAYLSLFTNVPLHMILLRLACKLRDNELFHSFTKELKLESTFRADLIVNDKVLIEMKAVESLADIHYAQTLTYFETGR